MAHHTTYGDRGPKCGTNHGAGDQNAGTLSAARMQATANGSDTPNLTQLLASYEAHSLTEPVPGEDYIVGAGYRVEHAPQKVNQDNAYNQFEIEIDHWIFTFKHVFMRQPVISMTVKIPCHTPNNFTLEHVKIMMRDTEPESENAMQNTISAALAMIQEIDKDRVPYSEQILKHYGVHPDYHGQDNKADNLQTKAPAPHKTGRHR